MARYIDADRLIKSLELSIKSWGRDCNSAAPIMMRAYQDAVYRVKDMPTADVVPKSEGEWKFDFTLEGDDFYECSVCGRQEVINGLCKERNPAEHYPYCHCGAKMKGGVEK